MKQCLQLFIVLFFIFCIAACSSSRHSMTMNNIVNVSGKVVDSANNPIVGASVISKRTDIGAVTDANGMFSLQKVPAKNKITISYIGYRSKEIQVTDSKLLSVVLYPVPASDLNRKIIICSISRKLLLSEAIAIRN